MAAQHCHSGHSACKGADNSIRFYERRALHRNHPELRGKLYSLFSRTVSADQTAPLTCKYQDFHKAISSPKACLIIAATAR